MKIGLIIPAALLLLLAKSGSSARTLADRVRAATNPNTLESLARAASQAGDLELATLAANKAAAIRATDAADSVLRGAP